MPPHVAAEPSAADRLRARWNSMFRKDNNSLYDVLLWQSLHWPCLTLQWQPQAWQPPGQLLQLQQAAAEHAANGALGIEDDDDAEAGAADMDTDGNHAAAAAIADKDDDLLPMPVEFQYLLMGDQTSQQEASHVALYRVALPGQLPAGFDPEQQQLMMMGADMEAVLVTPHGHQDVNKLHIMPRDLNLFATCCDDPQIYILDLQRQQEYQQQQLQRSPAGSSSSTSSDSESLQQQPGLTAVLGGRTAGGFGLEWNPIVAGLLLAGDVGGGVQLWDVLRGSSESSSSDCREIQPVQSSPGFAGSTINDVSWHAGGSTFAAATEKGELLLQDIRAPGLAAAAGSSAAAAAAASPLSGGLFKGAARASQVHVRRDRLREEPAAPDCLSVEFDPNHSYRLASGGRDGYVYILDMRSLNEPLERLALHAGDVRHVSWSKGAPGLLASAGEDSHLLLWDCNKMRHAKKQQMQREHRGATGSAAAAAAGSSKAAAAAAGSSRATAAGAGGGGGLGLPEPLKTQLSKSIEYLSDQGLLFPHHGHMGSVEQLAWNPDRPWMVASSSLAAWARNGSGVEEQVQGSTVMLWEVNRSCGLLC